MLSLTRCLSVRFNGLTFQLPILLQKAAHFGRLRFDAGNESKGYKLSPGRHLKTLKIVLRNSSIYSESDSATGLTMFVEYMSRHDRPEPRIALQAEFFAVVRNTEAI